jgi:hypothetical protein
MITRRSRSLGGEPLFFFKQKGSPVQPSPQASDLEFGDVDELVEGFGI